TRWKYSGVSLGSVMEASQPPD
ncbi:uncharacterized protein METZ01_LOCUS282153, partial [marine metagenome]